MTPGFIIILSMISVQGLASLLDRIDKEQVTIAVDGSLYKHHPRLEGWMKEYISLLAPGRQVRTSIKIYIDCKSVPFLCLEKNAVYVRVERKFSTHL